MGAAGFGAGAFSTAIYNRFVDLIAAQIVYFKTFQQFASPQASDVYTRTMSGRPVEEVDRMRKIALASADSGSIDGIAAGYWFETITAKIDQMKQVEDYVAGELQALVGMQQDAAPGVPPSSVAWSRWR